MNINIYVVGKLKEAYFREAEKEYLKRLSGYAKINVREFPDLPTVEKASPSLIEAIKEKEDKKILDAIKPGEYVVLLDFNGKECASHELAGRLLKWMVLGGSNLTFVIGGSLGLSESLRQRGNDVLTLSKLTFTHQLTRIILYEQLYRSFRINNGEPYDK